MFFAWMLEERRLKKMNKRNYKLFEEMVIEMIGNKISIQNFSYFWHSSFILHTWLLKWTFEDVNILFPWLFEQDWPHL